MLGDDGLLPESGVDVGVDLFWLKSLWGLFLLQYESNFVLNGGLDIQNILSGFVL